MRWSTKVRAKDFISDIVWRREEVEEVNRRGNPSTTDSSVVDGYYNKF